MQATITTLADALYNGEDCHYALADALLEAGHVELAEHFRDPGHPKGCWAVDAILMARKRKAAAVDPGYLAEIITGAKKLEKV